MYFPLTSLSVYPLKAIINSLRVHSSMFRERSITNFVTLFCHQSLHDNYGILYEVFAFIIVNSDASI